MLAAATGRSASHWRNRLNGNRTLQIEDLIAIALAFDADLFKSAPFNSDDLVGYFPPSARHLLSHTSLGTAIPTLDSAAAWAATARALEVWLRVEQHAGRRWLIDGTGLAHALVSLAAQHGIASMSASLAAPTDSGLDIEWIADDLVIRTSSDALYGEPSGAPTSSERVRACLRRFATDIDELAQLPQATKMLVTLMPPAALAALNEILASVGLEINERIVSLQHFHRLGGPDPPLSATDIHMQVLGTDTGLGLIWVQVK